MMHNNQSILIERDMGSCRHAVNFAMFLVAMICFYPLIIYTVIVYAVNNLYYRLLALIDLIDPSDQEWVN